MKEAEVQNKARQKEADPTDLTEVTSPHLDLERPPGKTTLSRGLLLSVEPGRVQTTEELLEEKREEAKDDAPVLIALDGRVLAVSAFNKEKKIIVIDHHHPDIDRASTYSTSKQVFNAIIQGTIDDFAVNGILTANIFVNDCDPDVCLAVWLLKNYEKVQDGKFGDKLEKLVELVDKLDRLGGAAKDVLKEPGMKKMAWIFEPYELARMKSTPPFSSLDGQQMITIMLAVGSRIDDYLEQDSCPSRQLDVSYDVIHEGDGWSLVEEQGYYARLALVQREEDGIISVRPRVGNRYDYTISRFNFSPKFSGKALYKIFNAAEEIPLESSDRWNGTDDIGGSARITGSSIPPKILAEIVDALLVFGNGSQLDDELVDRFISECLPKILHGEDGQGLKGGGI